MPRAMLRSVVCCLMAVSLVSAQERFSTTVGQIGVQAVQSKQPIEIPFITWGGDSATFHANGGLSAKRGSIYDEMGLNLKLSNGDDFVGQVKNYLSGKSPFLRGTFRMLDRPAKSLRVILARSRSSSCSYHGAPGTTSYLATDSHR